MLVIGTDISRSLYTFEFQAAQTNLNAYRKALGQVSDKVRLNQRCQNIRFQPRAQSCLKNFCHCCLVEDVSTVL